MGKRGAKTKFVITPRMHDEIKRVYQDMTGNGEVQELAERFNIPRWKISRHALQHGWVAKCKKEPNWSEKELKILERASHLTPERIQIRLRKAGYMRSVNGIVLKRKRMRFLQNLNGTTARSLAMCFGIDVHCITDWIEKGLLKAKHRGTKRTSNQGGDIWHIKERWVKDFIVNNVSIIDLRKVDKFWLVDILSAKTNEL